MANPCSNGCGYFGSPATDDLCSNCYRDFVLDGVKLQTSLQYQDLKTSRVSAAAKKWCNCRSKNLGGRPMHSGFVCRCGFTYCLAHRYPEDHACVCGFSLKEAERETNEELTASAFMDRFDRAKPRRGA